MKFFADKELREPLNIIHFGRVEVGTTKEINIYLLNNSKAILTNLQFIIKGPFLPPTELIEVWEPITIQPGQVGEVKLRWEPRLKYENHDRICR